MLSWHYPPTQKAYLAFSSNTICLLGIFLQHNMLSWHFPPTQYAYLAFSSNTICLLGIFLQLNALVLLHVVLGELLVYATTDKGHTDGLIASCPQRLGQLVTVHQHSPDHQAVQCLKNTPEKELKTIRLMCVLCLS